MKARAFLEEQWGSSPPGFIEFWRRDAKRSNYMASSKGVDAFAAEQRDLYVAAGLAARDYGARRRCPARERVAIPGLWLDLDVNSGPDGKAA